VGYRKQLYVLRECLNMTTAEIFLGVWAIVATVLAVMFHNNTKELKFKIVAILFSLDQIAEGKATIEKNSSGEVRVRSV
jgi:hypothetical protein